MIFILFRVSSRFIIEVCRFVIHSDVYFSSHQLFKLYITGINKNKNWKNCMILTIKKYFLRNNRHSGDIYPLKITQCRWCYLYQLYKISHIIYNKKEAPKDLSPLLNRETIFCQNPLWQMGEADAVVNYNTAVWLSLTIY